MAGGKYTGVVLLNLQKVFNTVNHDILCNELQARVFTLTLLNGLNHTYQIDNRLLV